MDQAQYTEMLQSLSEYEGDIFLFGHCEASLTVIDELEKRGYSVTGILDNSKEKQNVSYKNIPVVFPDMVVRSEYNADSTVVLIATRFYEQMNRQLRNLGFIGKVIKLVDYNTYAEYSLSEDTISKKTERVKRGERILEELRERFNGAFLIFCPFNALGDIYFCMSYLPEFLKMRSVARYAVCVPSKGCGEVAKLFSVENIAVLQQKDLDAAVQAALFTQDRKAFIAHQDRPYVINLHRALHIKKIPLEDIYKTGIFGLAADSKPAIPTNWQDYPGLNEIPEGKAAILSPYAKSVTAIPEGVWTDIVEDLNGKGYKLYTNVIGNEEPLVGTLPISPGIVEIKSVVERAGLFIGVRSGICDILRTANCRKIALFPD